MAQNPPVIGQFELLEPLGEGGMGTVFRARHQVLGREVALKLLKNPHDDKRLEQRFLREMRLMVELEHPALVRVLDGGVDERGPYLAMELVRGSSLRQVVLEKGSLSAAQVLAVAGKLADGIAHLHERDILHRDLSPGNVLLTSDGAVKILDFGLARPMDATMLTIPGDVIGTPSVLAPEAVTKGEHTQATDLWAVGCLMYLLATGRSPFPAQTVADLFAQVVHHPIMPPARVNPEIPEALSDLVMGLLERDPARRGPPAKELAAQCRRLATLRVPSHAIRKGIGARTNPASRGAPEPGRDLGVTPRNTSGIRAGGRSRWFLAGGAALAVGLALVVALLLSPPRPPANTVVALPPASPAGSASPASAKLFDWSAHRDAIPDLRAGGPRAKARMRHLAATLKLALPELPAIWLFAFDLSAWLGSPTRGATPPGANMPDRYETDEVGQLLLVEGWRHVLQSKPDGNAMLSAGLRHLYERPQDGRNWLMLAMVLDRQDRPEAARVLYRVALGRMRGYSLTGAGFYGDAAAWMTRNLGLAEVAPKLDQLFPPAEADPAPWGNYLSALERLEVPFLRALLEQATPSPGRAAATAPALARLYEAAGDRKRQIAALEHGLLWGATADPIKQPIAEELLADGKLVEASKYLPHVEEFPAAALVATAPRAPAGDAPLAESSAVCQAWVYRALLDGDPEAAYALWKRWPRPEEEPRRIRWDEATLEVHAAGVDRPDLAQAVRGALSGSKATFEDPAFDTAAATFHAGASLQTMEAELGRMEARAGMGPPAAVCRALWLARRGRIDDAVARLQQAYRDTGGRLMAVCSEGKQERAPEWITEIFLRASADPERAARLRGPFDDTFRREGLSGGGALVVDALAQNWKDAVRRARDSRHHQRPTTPYLVELIACRRGNDRAALERIAKIIEGHVRLRRSPLWLLREARAAVAEKPK